MILIEDGLCSLDIVLNLAALCPRNTHQPLNVAPHHRGFSRHGRHHFELIQLGIRLFDGFIRHLGFINTILKLIDLIRCVVHFAKLFLNGFHLLIQVVLTLAFFHLLFDATTNFLLDLEQIDL